MKAIAKRAAGYAGSSLWAGTSSWADSGGGATDVVVVRHPSGELACSSFHAQLPKLTKQDFMGTRVQVFVNNLPTPLSMVLDRDLICCFDDGSYRASSEELEMLNLKPGRNSVRYEMIHACNNDRRYTVKADIHLWNVTDKVVVVDIDGTVTKTDVAGFGAEKLGYEYIHAGVCEAVSVIARNGYRILFLTSRAITLAHSTRAFLRSIGLSNGGVGMPEFCLLTTTERFLDSLVVGVRSADKFKTVALSEVLAVMAPGAVVNSAPAESVAGWRKDTAPTLPGSSKWDKMWRGPAETEEDEASEASTTGGSGSDSERREEARRRGEREKEGERGERERAVHGPVDADGEGKAAGRTSQDSVEGVKVLLEGATLSGGGAKPAANGTPTGAKNAAKAQAEWGSVFVCGFGNRLTDTAAYAAVGVPPARNFLIDQQSQIRLGPEPGAVAFDGYTGLIPHLKRLLPPLVLTESSCEARSGRASARGTATAT